MTPTLFTRSDDLRRWRSTLPTNRKLAFVPTMGALHAGHERLMNEARAHANIVITSIFVNPRQFGDPADHDSYPRTLDSDIDVCSRQRVDAIFVPTSDEVYPANSGQMISAGRLGNLHEGKHRPGHFDGVLTVVDRLFTLVSPDLAVFGQKDYQQLVLLRQMSSIFHPQIRIVSVPTVRDLDGLAISSRNIRLSRTDRSAATRLYESLRLMETRYLSGVTNTKQLESCGRIFLHQFKEISLDYLVCVDPVSLEPIDVVEKSAVVLLGATIGNVRLIDNILLKP